MWGIHALERMTLHGVDLEEVREIVARGERIEDYPGDQPYPSALLLGWPSGRPVHVVVAFFPGEMFRIVTVYRPDPERWDASYRYRRPE
jgi:hypothetical protein